MVDTKHYSAATNWLKGVKPIICMLIQVNKLPTVDMKTHSRVKALSSLSPFTHPSLPQYNNLNIRLGPIFKEHQVKTFWWAFYSANQTFSLL